MTKTKSFNLLCGVAVLACAGQVTAATWGLTGGGFSGDIYNTVNGTDGTSIAISAYANTSGNDTSVAADSQLVALQTRTLQTANAANNNYTNYTGVVDWGSAGLGVVNRDGCGMTSATSTNTAQCDNVEGTAPEHAMDNQQRYEMMLLNFGTRQANITSMSVGWNGTDDNAAGTVNDSDMTVLAYTGTGNAAAVLATLAGANTWGALMSQGWSLIGNYSDVGTQTNNTQNLGTATYSSYWLIGAYNQLAGGGTWTTGNDSVKLTSIVATTRSGSSGGNSVPEPGSIALAGLALIAMVASRRRIGAVVRKP